MTKVEEVAKAIMDAHVKWGKDRQFVGDKEDVGILMARAAIAAMREPNNAMIDAMGSSDFESWDYFGVSTFNEEGAWRAAIDAALEV